MTDSLQPWQLGPTELISLALEHLHKSEDIDQRVTFLLLDVGVETLFKAYLTLPARLLSTNIPSEERQRAADGRFPQVCEGVERVAGTLISKNDLTNVQYFHRTRNRLYHDGVGITVPQRDVQRYAELAVQLVRQLLGVNLESALVPPATVDQRLQQEQQAVREAAAIMQQTNRNLLGARYQLGLSAERALERIYPDLVKPSFRQSFEELQKFKQLKKEEENQPAGEQARQFIVMTPELNRALELLDKNGQFDFYFQSRNFIDIFHYYLAILARTLGRKLAKPGTQLGWAGSYETADEFPNETVSVTKSYGDWVDWDEIPPSLDMYVEEGTRRTEMLTNAKQRIDQLLRDPNFESLVTRSARKNPRTPTTRPDQHKYDTLQKWLRDQPESTSFMDVSFAELESVLQSSLPASAYKRREWWSNSQRNTQAKAWVKGGWRVQTVDLDAQRLTFRRTPVGMTQPFFSDVLHRIQRIRPNADWQEKDRMTKYWRFVSGRPGFYFLWRFEPDGLRIEFFAEADQPARVEEIYARLFEQREKIETEIGNTLNWQIDPDKQACRVYNTLPTQITGSSSELESAKHWAVEQTIKFLDTFQPRINEL